MRSTKEWRGRTDNSMPPPSVRLRIFERDGGKCYLTGIKIQSGDVWHLDHIIAICNGGANCESNLAPALARPHQDKTRADRAIKRKDDRVKMKHWGIRKPSSLRSAGFRKAPPQRTASRPIVRARP